MSPILWRGAAGKTSLKQIAERNTTVGSVVISADGAVALSGPLDGQREPLPLWDLKLGTVRALSYTVSDVQALALSADARHVAWGGAGRTIGLLDTGKGKVRRLKGHTGTILAVAFSPDGTRVLSGGADKTVRLWDTRTGKELRRFTEHEGPVTCVALSPDGTSGLSGSADKTICLWQLRRDGAHVVPPGKARPSPPAGGNPDSAPSGKVLSNVQGNLAVTDPFDRLRRTSRAKVYNVKLTVGKTYQIDMISEIVDPYLRLEGPTGAVLAEGDDSGGGLNARIQYTCRHTGTYQVIATTFGNTAGRQPTGAFTLTIRED
jgi:WD40 repeat protein